MMQPNCLPCQGIQILTPRPRHNRAGLQSLKYRVGTHAAFLETMLATLAAQQINVSLDPDKPHPITPLNNRLTARSADDPSIAMLDAWSMIADILAFYQERNANEGYLRTATQYRSVHELSRLVGYTPRPGLASSVYLAFEAEVPPSVTAILVSLPTLSPDKISPLNSSAVVISKGTQAKSTPIPGTGDLPLTFETSDELVARPQWNAIRPRLTKPQSLVFRDFLHLEELYFEGIGLRLEPNDLLAITVGDDVSKGARTGERTVIKIQSVEEFPLQRKTRVVLEGDSLSVPSLCRKCETLLQAQLARLPSEPWFANVRAKFREIILAFIDTLPDLRLKRLDKVDEEIHKFVETQLIDPAAEDSPASIVAAAAAALEKARDSISKTQQKFPNLLTTFRQGHQDFVDRLTAESLPTTTALKQVPDSSARSSAFAAGFQRAARELVGAQGVLPIVIGHQPVIDVAVSGASSVLADVTMAEPGVATEVAVACVAGQQAGDVAPPALAMSAVTKLKEELEKLQFTPTAGKGTRFFRISAKDPATSHVIVYSVCAVRVGGPGNDPGFAGVAVEQTRFQQASAGNAAYYINPEFKMTAPTAPFAVIESPHLSLDASHFGFAKSALLQDILTDTFGTGTAEIKIKFSNSKAILISGATTTSPQFVSAFCTLMFKTVVSDASCFDFLVTLYPSSPVDGNGDLAENPAAAQAAFLRRVTLSKPPVGQNDNIFTARHFIASKMGELQGEATKLDDHHEAAKLFKAYDNYLTLRTGAMITLMAIRGKLSDSTFTFHAIAAASDQVREAAKTASSGDAVLKRELEALINDLRNTDDALRTGMVSIRDDVAGALGEELEKRVRALKEDVADRIKSVREKLNAIALKNLSDTIEKYQQLQLLFDQCDPQTGLFSELQQLNAAHSSLTSVGLDIFRLLAERRQGYVSRIEAGINERPGLLQLTTTADQDPIGTQVLKGDAPHPGILHNLKARVDLLNAELDKTPTDKVNTSNVVTKDAQIKALLLQTPGGEILTEVPEVASFRAVRTWHDSLKDSEAIRQPLVKALLDDWGRFKQQIETNAAPARQAELPFDASSVTDAISKLLKSRNGTPASTQGDLERISVLLGQDSHLFTQIVSTLSDAQMSVLFTILRESRTSDEDKRPRVYVLRSSANLFGWNSLDAATSDSEAVAFLNEHLKGMDPIKKGRVKGLLNQLGVGVPSDTTPQRMCKLIVNDPHDQSEKSTRMFLDGSFKKVSESSIVAVSLEPFAGFRSFRVRATALHPREAYGLTANCTQIELDAPWWSPTDDSLKSDGKHRFDVLSRAKVWCESEELTLAEEPIADPVRANMSTLQATDFLELDDVYFDLQLGKKVILRGCPTSVALDPNVNQTELAEIADIVHRKRSELYGDRLVTSLRFREPFRNNYHRSSVQIYGNVVEATHGETVEEVLGSGDGAKPYNAFRLRRGPLTRLPASVPSGERPELTVRVNDVAWPEVSGFDSGSETPQTYSAIVGADEQAIIVFGKDQARVPTGVENIRATYRAGLGLKGNVDARRIDQLPSPPRGVKAVQNPIRASGGADRDRIDDARDRAPLKTLAPNRLVSVRDYSTFASLFAGIGQATASTLSDVIVLTIAGQDAGVIPENSKLLNNLSQALDLHGDPLQTYRIVNRELTLLFIGAKVRINTHYLWSAVKDEIRAALYYRFHYQQARFGQDIVLADVISVIQKVGGVLAIDIEKFDVVGEEVLAAGAKAIEFKRKRRIESVPARFEPVKGKVPARYVGARLCHLSPDVPDMLILEQM